MCAMGKIGEVKKIGPRTTKAQLTSVGIFLANFEMLMFHILMQSWIYTIKTGIKRDILIMEDTTRPTNHGIKKHGSFSTASICFDKTHWILASSK